MKTREEWLHDAARALTPLLEEVGETVPPLHLSVGWPGGTANRNVTIGQCWNRASSEDEVNQIFISPMQGRANTVGVLGTLLHEMIHAVDDCESGHKGNFARIAKEVGFIPALTSSDNRSAALEERLAEVAGDVGEFPHAAILSDEKPSDAPTKQSARMIKAECEETGYKVRLSRKWIEEVGAPICPCCGASMEVEEH